MTLAAIARRFLGLAVVMAVVLSVGALPATANPGGTGLVVSQVYGGGGNSGGVYANDFIEIFNPTASPISLTDLTVQYASATGTGNFGGTASQITPLSGTLAAGAYLLVQGAAGTSSPPPPALPTPDITDGTPIDLSGTNGKVALVNSTTSLGCNGNTATTPCSAAQTALIIDLVGYGSATFFEGAAAPVLSNATAAFRGNGGCTDTDTNSTDFTAAAPTPRNSASPTHTCAGPTSPSGTGAANPASTLAGGSTLLTVAVTPGTNPTSTGIAVSCDLSAIGGSATQSFLDGGVGGDVTAGDSTFSFSATVDGTTTPGSKSMPCSVSDAQARSGSATVPLAVEGPLKPIHDIQGAAHVSPFAGQIVVDERHRDGAARPTASGCRTRRPDANDATSEGIFVFTSTAPTVAVGDSVHVNGAVQEFRPGGVSSANLTTTELGSPTDLRRLDRQPTPAADRSSASAAASRRAR